MATQAAINPDLPAVPVRTPSSSSDEDVDNNSATTPRSLSSLDKSGFEKEDGSGYLYDVKSAEPLAPNDEEIPTPGRALLVALGLKKAGRAPTLDAVGTLTVFLLSEVR